MLTTQLQHYLGSQQRTIQVLDSDEVMLVNGDHQEVCLNLSPLHLKVHEVSAQEYFTQIKTTEELIHAYHKAKHALPFEEDDTRASSHISPYARDYMEHALKAAHQLSHAQSQLIADFVKNLDIYTAVRSCETFFANHANLTLLTVAKEQQWHPIFDHLAIRTGCRSHDDARYIADYLIKHHGYTFVNVEGQKFYEFSDG